MLDDPLTHRIIGFAMKVHRALGPGFLESVYRKALLYELLKAGVRAEEESRVTVLYDGIAVGHFVADLLVERTVVIELKAVEALGRIHEVQTVNYLTATGFDIGLLINFGGQHLQFKRKYRQRLRQDSQDEQDSS
jgi:GxxExxY protein